MDKTYEACLVVDDFPANGSYWRRLQCRAFGYPAPEVCEWSRGWPRQSAAPFININVLHEFVDFIEEYDIKGKMTLLPCPAGLGRIDQSIRTLDKKVLQQILEITRTKLAKRFDLSLEVLTHSMGLDIKTGALLPHTESAWVSFLASPGRGHHEQLCDYIDYGIRIHKNAGFMPKCVSIGGMPDVSGIAGNKMLHDNYNIERLADAFTEVFNQYFPKSKNIFLAASSKFTGPISEKFYLPEKIKEYKNGISVFHIVSYIGEPLLPLFLGKGNPHKVADSLISADLQKGTFVETLEKGKALVLLTHAQTLTSLNTGLGFKALKIAIKRLHQKYGKMIKWKTPTEIIAANKAIYSK